MAIRLKDIARDLGVSTVTVSKVLREADDISEKTRQRVLKKMAELNYQPNMLARGLASGKSFTIGLVVPDLLHPFFAEFAKSLSGILRQNHYGLILTSSEDNPLVEQSEIRTMLARGVDAMLIASCQPTLQGFYGVENQKTPFILVDRNFPHLRANFVGTDDFQAGLIATQHLIAIGKQKIAYIGGPELSPGYDRLLGYNTALAQSGIQRDESYVLMSPRVEETGEAAGHHEMSKLLRLNRRPDAVFCYNDLIAIGAIQSTLEAGLSVPEDIAFVGCGNVRYSDYLRIPLTSIDQSTSVLGERVGNLALQLIREGGCTTQNIRIAPTLVVRNSSVLQKGC